MPDMNKLKGICCEVNAHESCEGAALTRWGASVPCGCGCHDSDPKET